MRNNNCQSKIEDNTIKGEKLSNPKYEVFIDADLKFRFNLIAPNGQIIASSEWLDGLWSKSDKIKLVTQKTNPLFFSWNKPEFPLEESGKKSSPYMKSFGAGQLFLTSHRFLWKTKDNLHYFWADKIISIYAEAGLYLDIFYGSTKYKFRIHKESLVKWITYSGSIAEETRIRNDHTILVSNY